MKTIEVPVVQALKGPGLDVFDAAAEVRTTISVNLPDAASPFSWSMRRAEDLIVHCYKNAYVVLLDG